MKTKFVRRSSLALAISEVIAWISFKFLLLLPLGHMSRHFFNLKKKKVFFLLFTNLFRVC